MYFVNWYRNGYKCEYLVGKTEEEVKKNKKKNKQTHAAQFGRPYLCKQTLSRKFMWKQYLNWQHFPDNVSRIVCLFFTSTEFYIWKVGKLAARDVG